MTLAFVLINVQQGTEEEAIDKLRTIGDVKEIYTVHGIYNLMVKIEADSLEKIKETIDLRIRKLEKVRSSITMIVLG